MMACPLAQVIMMKASSKAWTTLLLAQVSSMSMSCSCAWCLLPGVLPKYHALREAAKIGMVTL